jgi:hypothetical protein
MLLRRLLLAVVLLVASEVPGAAQEPRTLVVSAVRALQTGNLSIFGTQAQQRVRFQTGPSGVYHPLVAIGPITNVVVLGQAPMPQGVVIQGRAFHANGLSDWTLAYSFITQRIEFGNFNIPMQGLPPPTPTPASPAPGPPPSTPSVPTSTGDACAKYPQLC